MQGGEENESKEQLLQTTDVIPAMLVVIIVAIAVADSTPTCRNSNLWRSMPSVCLWSTKTFEQEPITAVVQKAGIKPRPMPHSRPIRGSCTPQPQRKSKGIGKD